MFFFFFSSRRRHTRYWRDWSSDVCSSDLPLSSGPGYKGSPSWSPQGGRVAFTMDGYAVDKSVTAGDLRRWPTRDFGAQEAEWTSESSLMILAVEPGEASRSVYRTSSEDGSLEVQKVAADVLAMSPVPERDYLIVAFETRSRDSILVLMRPSGKVDRVYTGTIEEIGRASCRERV